MSYPDSLTPQSPRSSRSIWSWVTNRDEYGRKWSWPILINYHCTWKLVLKKLKCRLVTNLPIVINIEKLLQEYGKIISVDRGRIQALHVTYFIQITHISGWYIGVGNPLFFPYTFQFTCVTFSVNTTIRRLKSFPLLIRSFITSASIFVDRELCAGPDTVYIGVAPSSLTLDDDVSTHVSRRFNSRGRPAATASNISSFHFQNRISINFYNVSHVYTNEGRKTKQWISIMTYKSTV